MHLHITSTLLSIERPHSVDIVPDYFRDGVGYCKAEEDKIDVPTLFDFMEVE